MDLTRHLYGLGLPGPLSIPRELAMEMTRFILDHDVDIALSHRLQVDHGCTQTLEEMTGSLGELEPLAVRLGLMQNTLKPHFHDAQLLVFAADHGLAIRAINALQGFDQLTAARQSAAAALALQKLGDGVDFFS